jgi:hypothetical protein
MSSTLVGVVLLVVILYVLRTLWARKESKPVSSLPPGPQPMPLLGNIRDLPPAGAQDWMHWVKHKAQYGMRLLRNYSDYRVSNVVPQDPSARLQ